MSDEKPMGQVIQIDEARIRDHLGELVRGTVEETLNAMLDAEADQLCGAGRYERSQARQDTWAGSYERTLQTSAGGSKSQGSKSCAARPLRRRLSTGTAAARVGRGGDDRDLSGGHFGAACGRHHRALWGTRVSPAQCRTSTRRSTLRSTPGGTAASRANTRTFISTELE